MGMEPPAPARPPRQRAFRGGDLHEAGDARQGGAQGREFARDGAQGTPPARVPAARSLAAARGERPARAERICAGAVPPKDGARPGAPKRGDSRKGAFSQKNLVPEGAQHRQIHPAATEGFAASPGEMPARAGKHPSPRAIDADFSRLCITAFPLKGDAAVLYQRFWRKHSAKKVGDLCGSSTLLSLF